jgi:hypothetical protein
VGIAVTVTFRSVSDLLDLPLLQSIWTGVQGSGRDVQHEDETRPIRGERCRSAKGRSDGLCREAASQSVVVNIVFFYLSLSLCLSVVLSFYAVLL